MDLFSEGVKPYPYQREGIEFAARAGQCIIADEMGLGKTIQAIGTAALLHREGFVNSVLVVCPTSLKYQWKREIRHFCGEEALVIEGTQLMRREMYRQPGLFKIVSYNALNNDIKASGSIQTDLLIMDEVQRLKNWDTQIARSARKVRSDYTVVLSGTPLETNWRNYIPSSSWWISTGWALIMNSVRSISFVPTPARSLATRA